MFKGKVSLILLIVISTIFIVGLIKVGGKVEAQINGFGASCVMAQGNCDELFGNYDNLYEAISSRSVPSWNGDFRDSILSSINRAYTNHPDLQGRDASSYVCFDRSRVTGFIPLPLATLDTGSQIQLEAVNYALSACGYMPDGTPTQPTSTGQGTTTTPRGDVWGCCPSGYTYAPPINEDQRNFDPAISQNAACCLTPQGVNSNDIFFNKADNLCMNADGSVFYNQNIPEVNGQPTVISDLSVTQGNYGLKSLPPVSVTLIAPISEGAPYKCNLPEDEVGCTIVTNPPEGGFEPVVSTTITSNGKEHIVVKSNLLDTSFGSGLSCQRCYAKGDPMFLEDIETNPNGKQQLVFCNPDTGALVEREDLINNSIADTLAALRAQDQENRDFIIQCTAGGGIPTAIGCVDASPIGIITGLIRIALGVIGGVALISLIIVGIQYQRGNDEEIKKARERLIAILTGVAFLVFSVLILRILGVNILDVIPAGSI